MADRLRASNTTDVGARSQEALHDRADPATPVDEGWRRRHGGGGRLRATPPPAAAAAPADILVVEQLVTAVR